VNKHGWARKLSPAERLELRAELGLEDSVGGHFLRFLVNAAHGNFRQELSPVAPGLRPDRRAHAATLELVAVAALLALSMGIPLGVLTALRRHSPDSAAVMTFSLAGVAMPTFVIGILLIYIFSVECKSWAPAIGLPGDWCFPSFGRGETVKIGWWSSGLVTAAGLKAIVLPAFTLSLFQMTLVLRLVRSQMLGSAAHRLHQVRARPRASPIGRCISATRSRIRCCR
jgi:peptide/nickel transport system permease protein